MINKFEVLVLFVVTLIFIAVGEVMFTDMGRYVKYDCRLVDVSPDIPEDVKRMCRSRR
jgi:hypothetical protein